MRVSDSHLGVADLGFCCDAYYTGDTCPNCFGDAGPPEVVKVIPVDRVAKVWRALERARDRWMDHALGAGAVAHGLRRQLEQAHNDAREFVAALEALLGEPDDGKREEIARGALHRYLTRYMVPAHE